MEMNGKLWECTESGSIADLISKPPIPPSIGNHEDTMALIRQSQCVVVYPSGAKVFRFGRVWVGDDLRIDLSSANRVIVNDVVVIFY